MPLCEPSDLKHVLTPGARLLGLDVGTKTIGMALSDTNLMIATPLDTIRRVLLASAAIPGAFPPSMIDVTVNGVAYQEMHVDGGAFAQVFLYPPSLTRLRPGYFASASCICA